MCEFILQSSLLVPLPWVNGVGWVFVCSVGGSRFFEKEKKKIKEKRKEKKRQSRR